MYNVKWKTTFTIPKHSYEYIVHENIHQANDNHLQKIQKTLVSKFRWTQNGISNDRQWDNAHYSPWVIGVWQTVFLPPLNGHLQLAKNH